MVSCVVLLILLFYSWPHLTVSRHPLPDSPELQELRKSHEKKGGLNEEEMKRLKALQDAHIRELKEKQRRSQSVEP